MPSNRSRRPSENHSIRPFDPICLDWFKLSKSYNHDKYALVITDEFSECVFIYTMAGKVDWFGVIIDFHGFVKKEFWASISPIRTDKQTGNNFTGKKRETPSEVW